MALIEARDFLGGQVGDGEVGIVLEKRDDLRHEALSRLADKGVPVYELQMLAGRANITTTQRYMNARANSLAESIRQARQRRGDRLAQQSDDSVQLPI
jgi:integrase